MDCGKMDKMFSDVIVSSSEIISDTLYFVTLRGDFKPKSTKNSKYFNIDNEIVYDSFISDYGPHHLCHSYFFCKKLSNKLKKLTINKKLVFYTSCDKILRLNAAYLIGSYMIIYLNKEPQEVWDKLITGDWELLTFRDASGGHPLFEINLLDVFEGLQKAFILGFFDFQHFDHKEYMHYEKVNNGDLNWIIPGKMLAFSGPHSKSRLLDDYPVHAPEYYHKYFRDNNVTTIVRLNQKSYNAKQFTDFGFDHHELFFVDGSVPTNAIVDKFNVICEKTSGAVAVHCKAGLGRTGTLIGCYMMKHYEFTARQAISWLRICRPGSVIAYQQIFLSGIQSRMWTEGEQYRRKHGITEIPKFKFGVYHVDGELNSDDVENANLPESDISNNSSSKDTENVIAVKSTRASIKISDRWKSNAKVANSTPLPKTKKMGFTPVSLSHITMAKTQTGTTPRKSSTLISSATKATTKNSITTESPRNNFWAASQTRCNLRLSRNVQVNSYSTCKTRKLSSSIKTTEKKTDVRTKEQNVISSPTKIDTNKSTDCARKKMVLRKKTLKTPQSDQVKELKNCHISSDSERDSTNTTLTNISADSLENIPCKMPTRRDKSKSPEPVYPLDENIDNMEDIAEPQGTKLCQIKASRKKVSPVPSVAKKEGIKTRNYMNPAAKKK